MMILLGQGTISIDYDTFQDCSRDFCFSSFLTKPEIIKIIVQVQSLSMPKESPHKLEIFSGDPYIFLPSVRSNDFMHFLF